MNPDPGSPKTCGSCLGYLTIGDCLFFSGFRKSESMVRDTGSVLVSCAWILIAMLHGGGGEGGAGPLPTVQDVSGRLHAEAHH